jgi:hypothetical protein
MKGRQWVGCALAIISAYATCGASEASAQSLAITNTTHTPALPRAGQDVFIETQTSPTGSAVEAYALFGVGENWSEAPLGKIIGSTNDFDQWRGRIGRFQADTMVEYLAGAEDSSGTNRYDPDGTNYYVFSVTNGDATTWIGGIYHSPSNGALTSDTNLTLNLFASPSQTLVNAFAEYSVNGWIWERIALDFVRQEDSNELWQAEIVPLPPGSTVWYAFDAEDGMGAIHIRPTSGLPYSAIVNGDSADGDSDNLPDDWEQFWFGALTNTTAGGNSDEDGLTGLPMDNWIEYVAGTDPADSNVVEDIRVLWRPSRPMQGGAMQLLLNEDPWESLVVSTISVWINEGPGFSDEEMVLQPDANDRFSATFLLATNASQCKVVRLVSENGTNDNRGIGWTIPVVAPESGLADSDGDGMSDAWELQYGFNPFVSDASDDADGDDLGNGDEYSLGTDPWLLDTDGDGWSDGEEVLQSTDPLDRMDAPEIARGVVINEVLYDPAGDDTGKEFIELYSSSPFDVDLSGFRLQGTLSSNPSNFLNIFTFPTGTVIQARRSLLIGGSLMTVSRDYTTNFALVNRSSGNQKTAGVRLLTPSTMSPTTTVDALLYNYPNTFNLPTNGYGAVSATNIYATSSNSLARRLAGWDTDHVSDWIRTNNPTPTSSSTVCDSDGDGWSDAEEIQAGTSPWDRLDAPRIARGVVINEALYDPSGTDDHKEWIELYCSSPLPVNLGGFSLRGTLSINGGTNLMPIFTFPAGTQIQPGRHLLIGGTNSGVTPDFATNFALINRGQGDKTGGIYLMVTNSSAVTTRVDALLYSYPNTFNLPTNEFGFIDSTNLPPFANKSGESIARRQIGVDTDSISDWRATSNRTPTASVTFVDSDGDGLSDADEITGSLNPYGAATDYLSADSDGDGLSDGDEVAAGTNPNNVDTDGDGVSDQVEVVEAGSDPLAADFNGRVHQVWSAWGADYANCIGIWTNYATSAYAFSQGGIITYSMTLATGGVYALTVEGTQFDGGSTVNEFTLQLFVDDVLIGEKELRAALGVQGEAQWMMPWLSGGVPHEISIRWRFKKGNGSLRILRLVAEEWGGPDADENGIMDWQDHRLDTLLTSTYWPTSSLVSPVCLEGRSREFGLLQAQSDYIPSELFPTSPMICHGLGDGWLADLPLNPEANTHVQVICDNGQASLTGSIAWAEFNLLAPATNRLLLRKNDGLKWNLRPVSLSNGTVKVYTNGALAHVSATNAPWVNAFTNAGIYLVSGVWSNAGVSTYSSTVTVEVVDASFAGNPAVWVGYARTWNCPGIPTNVWVGFDPEVAFTRAVAPTGAIFTIRMGQAESHSAVARLGGTNGSVIATARVHGFSQLSTTDLNMDMYFYADGSGRIDIHVLIDAEELPLDVDAYIELVGGGLYFAGGGTSMQLEFDETGMASATIYMAADSWAAFCHSLYVEQDGVRIGDR